MTRQLSFTKMENELLPKFRKMTNEAESTVEVQKFFIYCMQELFSNAFDGQLELQFEDVELLPEREPPFVLSEKLKSREEFIEAWSASDLPQIVGRFADLALNRYKHLAKNPGKTEAKMHQRTATGR